MKRRIARARVSAQALKASLRQRVLVFAKAPVAGQVKTRLAGAIGADAAAELYRRLAWRTLRVACAVAPQAVELWCAPDTTHGFFVQCTREFGVTVHPQVGEDLGSRMALALEQALGRADRAVLIGTDCPDYDACYLRSAFSSLCAGRDVVLGPAQDGGYALIGMSSLWAEVFRDIPWGSSGVLAQTRRRLAALGLDWHELPWVRDIDRPEDVSALAGPLSLLGEECTAPAPWR